METLNMHQRHHGGPAWTVGNKTKIVKIYQIPLHSCISVSIWFMAQRIETINREIYSVQFSPLTLEHHKDFSSTADNIVVAVPRHYLHFNYDLVTDIYSNICVKLEYLEFLTFVVL